VTVTLPFEYKAVAQPYPFYKDPAGCPVPAPAKGGELAEKYVTSTTVEYMHVCPTDPARLEPTYYEHTYTLSDCHCGETAKTGYTYAPPKYTSSVAQCKGCGPAGEDYVTLSVPCGPSSSSTSKKASSTVSCSSSSSYVVTKKKDETSSGAYAYPTAASSSSSYGAKATTTEAAKYKTAGAGRSSFAGPAVLAAFLAFMFL
jgi:hypothetical protein